MEDQHQTAEIAFRCKSFKHRIISVMEDINQPVGGVLKCAFHICMRLTVRNPIEIDSYLTI